jgi:serine/threonine protein kinase
LTQLEVLGQGAQGTVYKCKTSTGEEVVSKEMIFPPRDEATFNERLRQVQAMQRLSHPHLIKYLDVVPTKLATGFKISVIMPYYSESDLATFIQKQRRPVDEHRLCSLLLQVVLALRYLHQQVPPIAHRDVKPENILMRQRGEQALLMDLDTCREMSAGLPRGTRTILGTMEYMAPEVQHGNATVKCDVWSLGVVAFTLAALPEFATLPLNGQQTCLNARDWTEVLLSDAVTRAVKANCHTYSERLVQLICKMLRHEETRRPDSAAVETELRGILEDNLLRGS